MDLEKLKTEHGGNQPYTKSLKIKVVKMEEWKPYKRQNGKESKYLKFVSADKKTTMKGIAYDYESQHTFFSPDICLLIKNYSFQNQMLKITTQTKIYRCEPITTCDVTIDDNYISLAEVQNSPTKKVVTVQGLVTKDETVKDVAVRGTSAKVKEITLADESGTTVHVSLWDTDAQEQAKCGKTLRITDAVVKYSSYHNANTLSVSNLSSIESIIEMKEVAGRVIAVKSDSEEILTMIFEKEDGIETEFQCKKQVFNMYLNIDMSAMKELLEVYITPLLPICCKVTVNAGQVEKME